MTYLAGELYVHNGSMSMSNVYRYTCSFTHSVVCYEDSGYFLI